MNAETRHNERIAELEEALRKEREKTPAELIELAWERTYPSIAVLTVALLAGAFMAGAAA